METFYNLAVHPFNKLACARLECIVTFQLVISRKHNQAVYLTIIYVITLEYPMHLLLFLHPKLQGVLLN